MKGLRRHIGSQESSSQCERNDEKRNDVPLHLNPNYVGSGKTIHNEMFANLL